MDVILADTHGPILGKQQGTPNLGLLYLAAWARQRIEGLRIHYIPQRHPLEHHLRVIEERRPAAYALSFTSYGGGIANELARRIKERHPKLPVILGGPHVSAVPVEALERSGADVCVIGEGEQTFTELLGRIESLPVGLASVRGVVFRDGSHAHRTPPRPLIDDLDTVPFPARDLVDDRDYVGLSHRRARPNAEMIITRGCPFRCVFCANPVFRVDGPAYRTRSPESIASEAEELYQRGYREIYLHSDELNVDHDWSVAVCKALAELGHADLFFQANLRVSPMSEELAHWLRRANFWLVRFGIESASQRVLSGTKKKMAGERTARACRLLSEEGIRVWGYFLLFQFWEDRGRLEYERPDEVRETLRSAWRMWREGVLHYSSWMYAIPVQGAELHDVALRHGMIDSHYLPSESWDPSEHVPGVHPETFRRLFAQARALQGLMALRSGGFELRNWRGILSRARAMTGGVGRWPRRAPGAVESAAPSRARGIQPRTR